jgi:tripartite-type tricarboxylate transporter receptor subunit TctC
MKCLSAFALLLAGLIPIGAAAQTDWPRKPVQIVVPYGAGCAAQTTDSGGRRTSCLLGEH